MKKLLKISAPVCVLIVGIMVVKGLAAARPEPERKEQETRLVSLYVDEARQEQARVSVVTQGEVRAKTEIELVPQVSGRIVALSDQFNPGAEFQPGDVLLKIDDTDYRLALARAEAAVAQAKTQLERQLATKAIKAREWQAKAKPGDVPTDFSLNLTQVAEAEAMLRSAEAELRKARLDLERAEIRVPFHGRVLDRQVSIGQLVTAGTPLGTVFSVAQAEVRLPLTDQQLIELNLTLGYEAPSATEAPKVTFSALMGNKAYQWQGHITRVSAAVDRETRLIYATAEVTDPYGQGASEGMPMAVGLFVDASIDAPSIQDAVVMPRLALRNDNQVYVIDQENRLDIRTVEVLSTSEERVLVASGVLPGEQVVTSALPNAVHGMEVQPLNRSDVSANQG